MRDSSRRFQLDQQWLAARYRYRHSKISNSVAYQASCHLGDNAAPPTAGQIRRLANHTLKGQDRNHFDKEMEILLKKLTSYGCKMKSSFIAIKHERKHLLARLGSSQMSQPVWFLTLSSADLYWPELWQAITKKSTEECQKLSLDERKKALQDNPVLAARMFKIRVECILKFIIKGDCHPLGFLLDHWMRIEFQSRGKFLYEIYNKALKSSFIQGPCMCTQFYGRYYISITIGGQATN